MPEWVRSSEPSTGTALEWRGVSAVYMSRGCPQLPVECIVSLHHQTVKLGAILSLKVQVNLV